MGPNAQANPEVTNDDIACRSAVHKRGVVTNACAFTPRSGVSSLAGDPPPGSPLLKKNESIRIPVTPRVTRKHTSPRGEARTTKVRTNVRVRAAKTKNEDMKRGQDRTKVRVIAMKGEPSAQGQPMNPTSLRKPGRPETWA